jgi:pilus assembly protein CpaB
MNPRQRRGVLFLAFAVIGAVAVFFSVVGYVNDVESQVGNRVTAYVVDAQVDAYQPLDTDDLEEIEVPERWLPEGAVRSLDELIGNVTAAQLSKGTLLQTSNLVRQPSLEPGQREIAILVDAETGVAGKVAPGDYVDVWATFDESITGAGARTKLIAQRLLVIDVGLKVSREKARSNGAISESQAVPVTFATERSQIQALSFAESFAIETRLALRPPGDSSVVPGEQRTYEETFTADEGGVL